MCAEVLVVKFIQLAWDVIKKHGITIMYVTYMPASTGLSAAMIAVDVLESERI